MERTQQHVLSCTSRLLVYEGVDAVTFSRVSHESRVARSTLYRHWQSRDELVCAAALPGFSGRQLGAQIDLRQFLLTYLVQTNAGLVGSAARIAFTHALDVAQTSDLVRRNLRLVAASFRRVLEHRLGPMDAWDHARLVGPVFFQAIVMGQETDVETLDRWVRDILAMPRRGTARADDSDIEPGNIESGNMGG